MHQEYLKAFADKAASDVRVLGTWIEGSFAKGTADRYSDIDIHLLVAEEDKQAFQQGLESWLSDVQSLVLFREVFPGQMITCITTAGLRVDVWLHTGNTIILFLSIAQRKNMKAIVFSEQGSTEVLQYTDVPKPTLDTNEALIKVEACAVNYLDIHARRNRPEIEAKLRRGDTPHILGSDIAGTIAEIGAAARGVAVGDRVVLAPCTPCGICSDCHRGAENLCDTQELIGFQTNGGYAEYVKAPAQNAIQMSAALSFVNAAAMPIAYLTAWHMLMTRAQLRPEDDVLILGVGGGVGSAGLQIAKLTGARVFATASSDEKLERARQMGADVMINYKDTDFSEVVLDVTKGRGVDVVLEHVGAATWDQSIASLAKNGRLVSCGVTTGNIGTINIRKMYQKQLTVMGSALGTVAELRTLVHLAGRGKLEPIIDRVLPLHRAGEAHLLLENRQNFGKICLCPNI